MAFVTPIDTLTTLSDRDLLSATPLTADPAIDAARAEKSRGAAAPVELLAAPARKAARKGPRDTSDPEHGPHQVASLCWRESEGRPEVLLITSRDTGRWVVPKGWRMPDRSHPEAAATEAWEEAGVEGQISTDPLGSFSYDKRRAGKQREVSVTLYPLEVAALHEEFPEARKRKRRWFTPEQAAEKVAEAELRALILDFGATAQRPANDDAELLAEPMVERDAGQPG